MSLGNFLYFRYQTTNLNLNSNHTVVYMVHLPHVMSSNFGHKYTSTVIIPTITLYAPRKHLLTINYKNFIGISVDLVGRVAYNFVVWVGASVDSS